MGTCGDGRIRPSRRPRFIGPLRFGGEPMLIHLLAEYTRQMTDIPSMARQCVLRSLDRLFLIGYSAPARAVRRIPRSGSKNSNSSPDEATATARALTATKPTNASTKSCIVPIQNIVILRRAFLARRRAYATCLASPVNFAQERSRPWRGRRERRSLSYRTPVPKGTAYNSPGRKSGVSLSVRVGTWRWSRKCTHLIAGGIQD
jgi:hypothetical protein